MRSSPATGSTPRASTTSPPPPGYTKGAVYSNFANKAGLYLAVLDRTIEVAMSRERSPLDDYADEVAQGEPHRRGGRGRDPRHLLASLEFIATAMRDPELAAQLDERIQRLGRGSSTWSEQSQSPDDPIDAEELGTLVFAFQQGLGLLQGLGVARRRPRSRRRSSGW
jgi:AcrR family transcriptional regulator